MFTARAGAPQRRLWAGLVTWERALCRRPLPRYPDPPRPASTDVAMFLEECALTPPEASRLREYRRLSVVVWLVLLCRDAFGGFRIPIAIPHFPRAGE
jgi:hypothetical protein